MGWETGGWLGELEIRNKGRRRFVIFWWMFLLQEAFAGLWQSSPSIKDTITRKRVFLRV